MVPHSYYDYCNVTFLDGTTRRIGGNREEIDDGLLVIYTDSQGYVRDRISIPLSSIKYWEWEKES